MATSVELFRKLGAGLRFDFQRFRSDAEKFQLNTTEQRSNKQETSRALDIFGSAEIATKKKDRGLQTSQSYQQTKRKRKKEENPSDGRSLSDSRPESCLEEEEEEEEDEFSVKARVNPKITPTEGLRNSLPEFQQTKKSNIPLTRPVNGRKKTKRQASEEDDKDYSTQDDGLDSTSPSKRETPEEMVVSSSPQKRKKKKRRECLAEEEDVPTGEGEVQLLSSLHPRRKQAAKKNIAEKQEELRRQEVRAFRRQHKIHVWGTDIPDPVATFSQLQTDYNLHPDIVENIHRAGFPSPTQVQMQAIPTMLHRREILACAPTGSGKTAAFILPILAHLKEPRKKGFRAVVISPTRELANQTYREFQRLSQGRGFRIHVIESTGAAKAKFGPESSQRFDILVTTPNRLVYLLNEEPSCLSLNNVEWLVIDESDKLFEEGKSGFRDQLATIYRACDSVNVRRALFSATFAQDVEQWCKLNLDNVVTVTIGQRNTATELVEQELVFVGGEYGKLLAVRDIFRKGFQPPILIFVQSKDRAKELFQELIYDGYNVDVIHADKTQTQRDNIVKSFRAGKIWVLISTELMGRGIDFKGINLVINYDFPTSAISYIHRIGRTGRAGRPGKAVTFFTEDDLVHLRSIATVMRNAGCHVPEYMLNLRKLNKKKQKKFDKRPLKRDTIRTLPKQELIKAKKKRNFIKRAIKENTAKNSDEQNSTNVTEREQAGGKKPRTNKTKRSKVKEPGGSKAHVISRDTKPRRNKGKAGVGVPGIKTRIKRDKIKQKGSAL